MWRGSTILGSFSCLLGQIGRDRNCVPLVMSLSISHTSLAQKLAGNAGAEVFAS